MGYPQVTYGLEAVLGDGAFPDIDTARIGLKGSPTNVKKAFMPQKKTGGMKIKEAKARRPWGSAAPIPSIR